MIPKGGRSTAHPTAYGWTSCVPQPRYFPGRRRTAMPDAAVVGSGPNGLAAAVVLARAGLKVHVYEAAAEIGGGTRTTQLIEDGHWHDVCSAVHPMALASPCFKAFELPRRIELALPKIQFASPLDHGRAALAYRSLDRTAEELGRDGRAYRRLLAPLVRHLDGVVETTSDQLLRIPADPFSAAIMGLRTLEQGSPLWNLRFRDDLAPRSEEHTSELQSPCNPVCRLLLAKKKTHCDP